VGEDVLDAFIAASQEDRRDATSAAFRPVGGAPAKYFADIYALARMRLADLGIDAARVHGGTHCTVTEKERFYSYRRDRVTGRMAAMIWLNE
jgi:polyphenol oxidase